RSMNSTEQVVAELADRLWRAEVERVPIQPISPDRADLTVPDGYALQTPNITPRVTAGSVVRGPNVGPTPGGAQRPGSGHGTGGRLTPVAGIDLRLEGMLLYRNGAPIESAAGAAALGSPARSIAWLVNKLGTVGSGLRRGDIVLPGALHRMVPVRAGDCFRAHF